MPNLYKCSVAPIYVNFHIYDEMGNNSFVPFFNLYNQRQYVIKSMFTTIQRVKEHLNISPDFHGDDQYLIYLIQVAENAIEKRIDRKLTKCVQPDGYLPFTIQQSILLFIGHLYANREAVSLTSATEMPLSFNFLADLDKFYFIP